MSSEISGHLAAKGTAPNGNMPAQHGLESAMRDVKRALERVGQPPAPLPHYHAARFAAQQEVNALKAREQRDADRERQERQREASRPVGVIAPQ